MIRNDVADAMRAALDFQRVSPHEIKITREDDGRWRIEWDASEDVYGEVTFTLAKLQALSAAFSTTAIDILADPGEDGDWTYGGGGQKGRVRLVLWLDESAALQAARTDLITFPR